MKIKVSTPDIVDRIIWLHNKEANLSKALADIATDNEEFVLFDFPYIQPGKALDIEIPSANNKQNDTVVDHSIGQEDKIRRMKLWGQ